MLRTVKLELSSKKGGSSMMKRQNKSTRTRSQKREDSGWRQISLFDFPDFDTLIESNTSQLTFFVGRTFSQQIIDTALRLGGNEPDCMERIVAHFSKGYPLEKDAQFIQKEYGRDGKGFFIGDEPYALWFDENGLRLASGRTAMTNEAEVLPWERVAQRIRELLNQAQYAPQCVIDRAAEMEKTTLATNLLFLVGDLSEDAREHGYMPTVRAVYDTQKGYPDMTESLSEKLNDSVVVQDIINDLDVFIEALAQKPNLLHFRHRRVPELMENLRGLQRKIVNFPPSVLCEPAPKQFISEDEIYKLLTGNGSIREPKFDIFSYYCDCGDHTPKERADFLKHTYGHGGNGRLGFATNYDSKGISYARESKTFQTYDKILLSWSQVDKRISKLIQDGRYMTEKELAYIPNYEKKQLARIIYNFFCNVSPSEPRPYPDGLYFTDAIEMIRSQLDDSKKVEDIYRMMLSVWESSSTDDRSFNLRKKGIDSIIAYRNGTFSLFGKFKHTEYIA